MDTDTASESLTINPVIPGAFALDPTAMEALEAQFRSVPEPYHELRCEVQLTEGRELKGSSFRQLLSSPLLNEFPIIGLTMSVDNKMGSYRYRLSDYQCQISISTKEPALGEAIARNVTRTMNNNWKWYSVLYQFQGEMFGFAAAATIFVVALHGAVEVKDPNWAWILVALPAYAVVSLNRRLLFRKLEFEVGLSKRHADNRRTARRFIWGTIVLGAALSYVAGLIPRPF